MIVLIMFLTLVLIVVGYCVAYIKLKREIAEDDYRLVGYFRLKRKKKANQNACRSV